MILLWLLCVGLILGGLLASLARQVRWGRLALRRARPVPVPVLLAKSEPGSRRRSRRRGRGSAPPGGGLRPYPFPGDSPG